MHGFPNFPTNPFDSASGNGAGSEGAYKVTITEGEVDVDVYGVVLKPGDVLGLSASGGAGLLGILERDGELVHGSNQDLSFIYPLETPLPGGGNAVNDHLADQRGWHYIAVESGSGSYDVTAEVADDPDVDFSEDEFNPNEASSASRTPSAGSRRCSRRSRASGPSGSSTARRPGRPSQGQRPGRSRRGPVLDDPVTRASSS